MSVTPSLNENIVELPGLTKTLEEPFMVSTQPKSTAILAPAEPPVDPTQPEPQVISRVVMVATNQEWKIPFYDCLKSDVCCYGLFFPYSLASDLKVMVQDAPGSCCGGAGSFQSLRSYFRAKHDIPGSVHGDYFVASCCIICGTIQLYEEMRLREKNIGASSAKFLQQVLTAPESQVINRRGWLADTEEWKVSLLDSCSSDSCCYAYFCTCCFMNKLRNSIESPVVKSEGCCQDCCCLFLNICCGNSLGALRSYFRGKNGIKGSVGKDNKISSWCTICSMIQLHEEVRVRQHTKEK